jgi:putative colanic acid biosynthesis acetyltransferase WcaF
MVNIEPSMDESRTKWVSLAKFSAGGYSPGKSVVARTLWYFVSLLVFESGWFPLYGFKRVLLRSFGASVGRAVVVKPRVRIKYPWLLRIGNHCWIGESVWIDNLAVVHLGNDVCLSQGAYLCTGSHDYRRSTFDLIVKPIVIEAGAWVAARAVVLPGVTIGEGAVVAAGSIVAKDIPAGVIAVGSPCRAIGERPRPAEF